MDGLAGAGSKSPIAIVGNGAAAVEAILSLRECRYDGEIHLFSDSPHAAYNPMLTSYYAGGAISLDQCFLFGSGLGSGSLHSNTNLPIILAGGGFEHGQHIDGQEKQPLCNLFLSVLQEMGAEQDYFNRSNGTLTGLA